MIRRCTTSHTRRANLSCLRAAGVSSMLLASACLGRTSLFGPTHRPDGHLHEAGDSRAADESATGDTSGATGDLGHVAIEVIPVVGWTQGTTYDSDSYVDLDVDWSRSLAYAASREPGVCVAIFDLTDMANPTLLANLSPETTPATGGDRCLGVRLFAGGTRLAVSCSDTSVVEIWDLGADPRTLAWSGLSSAPAPTPTRMEIVESNPTTMVVGVRWSPDGARRFEIVGGGTALVDLGTFSNACSHNHVTPVANNWVITACWEDGSSIVQVAPSNMTMERSIDMDNGGTSGFWSGAISADGTRVFQGGWVAGFLEYVPGGTDEIVLRSRFNNPNAGYRSAQFVEEGGAAHLYVITGDRVLEVWDATDLSSPHFVRRGVVDVATREGYGVKVDVASRRAIVVANGGQLVVIDIDTIPVSFGTHDPF
ncbi:hypothetical protein ACFL6C_01955 [Myxococcota bacterium]